MSKYTIYWKKVRYDNIWLNRTIFIEFCQKELRGEKST